ncbi:MAG: 16S rRNA (guanine(966)-N(2))-methyltransferase RsmD, partial [Lachnospiraceae bacterium]|nr:16S rRNA (guanine(966)-N(2))-methyltransferase RsmD [Lachnospiraceae bacterium]
TSPTPDRIKETLFTMLQPHLSGALFVDLFSGSGGIGIEALSRGARHAYFVENDKKALACILENLQFTRLSDQATVLKTDVLSALYGIHEKEADMIFMDPPYGCGHERRALAVLRELSWVTQDSLIVIETSLQSDLSWLEELGFSLEKEKRYKTNCHLFCRKN